MTAPAFILEAETAYNTTTPKTTAAFNVLQGDVLVAYVLVNDNSPVTISNSGAALNWTLVQSVAIAAFAWIGVWVVVSSQSRAALTVTFTRTAGLETFGGDVLLVRGSAGVGASSVTNVTSGTPSLNLTTTTPDSMIVVVNGDWVPVDGAARAWLTNAGALTETTYSFTAGTVTAYGGYHASAGPVGTYAVGLSAPAGQKYSIAAVEVLGQVTRIMHVPIRQRLRW